MSKNKSIELNSAKIINIRKNLDMTINKYWKIICAENVMAKKAIAAGQGSGYDLKGLYNEITQMSEKRIIIRVCLCCSIWVLQSSTMRSLRRPITMLFLQLVKLKEAIAKLKMIPTINPSEKASKGKKHMGKTESFTSAKIASLVKESQLKANKFDAKLKEFNDNTNITCTDDIAEKFSMDLAV